MADADERLDAATAWWRLCHGRLAPGEQVEMPMLSGSMLPLLPVGATLVIAGVARDASRVGDIVVFRDGERLVAHRLLLGLPPGRAQVFLQAGDGVSPLGWLAAGKILGLVIAVRGQDRSTRDLRQLDERRDGIRMARRRLRRFATELWREPLRKARSWLLHR